MRSGGNVGQLHQVLAIGGNEYRIVVNRPLAGLGADAPTQRGTSDDGRKHSAVVNATLNLGAFLVVVPCSHLHGRELVGAGIVLASLGERVDPGKPALLIDNAVRAPGGKGVVEPFIAGAGSVLRRRLRRTIEA